MLNTWEYRVWNRLEIHEIEITAEMRQCQIIDIAAFYLFMHNKVIGLNRSKAERDKRSERDTADCRGRRCWMQDKVENR